MTENRSDAYWAGRLSEHLRWLLRDEPGSAARQAAAEALAEFDAWDAARRPVPT